MWEHIVGQDDARAVLQGSSKAQSHAYLLVGLGGTGKTAAARAMAAVHLCEKGGCGVCSVCRRIARNTHPDVMVIDPEGSREYVIEQIRDLSKLIQRTPLEGKHRYFIIRGADLLGEKSANAFLKSLEEPPEYVTYILLAHNLSAVTPTIRSRCIVVKFKTLSSQFMEQHLCESTGVSLDDARVALASCGNVLSDALEFLNSIARMNTRAQVVRCYQNLMRATDGEVLGFAQEIVRAARVPVEELKEQQGKDYTYKQDFLDKSGLRQVELSQKRALSAFEKRCVAEVFCVFESLMRDVVCIIQGASVQVCNMDTIRESEEYARAMRPADVAIVFEIIDRARKQSNSNVGTQLTLEAMLLKIREVLL